MTGLLSFLGNRRFFRMWERLGVHVTPVHFYQPIPETAALAGHEWGASRSLPGLTIDHACMSRLLSDHLSPFITEFSLLYSIGDGSGFPIRNGLFEEVDADMLYAFVRMLKPARIIEIGCGYSSWVIDIARQANLRETTAADSEHVMIDPYPSPVLSRLAAPGRRLIGRRVQDVPWGDIGEISERDILFIDSSHVVSVGSDVEHEFRELIPRVSPGAYVHVHDIFTPQEYPRQWVYGRRMYWNEQYLLENFLAFNAEYETVWAGNSMRLHHPDVLAKHFPAFRPEATIPGSFWFRRRGIHESSWPA
jgi:predicted O-methyltransferase YrrM